VLDFYCSEAKVAIEIDGMAHDLGNRPERDRERAAWLKQHGVETIRVSGGEVTKAPDAAAEAIVFACLAKISPLHQPAAGPPPRSGEETT